jgi:CIC family chloride channel protein
MSRNENNILGLTAIGVGVLAGVAAVALQSAISLFGRVFLGSGDIGSLSLIRIAIAPAIGGLLVGPLIARGAREAKGHGVPEVMEAVAMRGGRIRGRVATVKILASALTIGSGGSAGREGPIVQVGAALGSKIGSLLKMSDRRVRVLVGCGAAGGIAAAFNAPLAGMFFALEVILQRFSARGVGAVALSSVTAAVIWRTAFGNEPVLEVPFFGLQSPWEMGFYLVLGLLAAVVAFLFVRSLYFVEDRFDALPLPLEVKPMIGGALLGVLGLATVFLLDEPLIYGSGFPGMNAALGGELVWWALLLLVFGKIIATSLTLGSGGSGGVFAPSLFIGAMLGGVVGQAVNALFPGTFAGQGAYVMVGMAAVFSAAAQAPISAILILFEMTNDFRIILPLMLSCVVATFAYTLFQRESIYTAKLARRGIEMIEGRERHLMERVVVTRGMVAEFPKLELPSDMEALRRLARETDADTVVVVDEEGRLAGTIRLGVLAESGVQDMRELEQLIEGSPITVLPTETLDQVLGKMALRGIRVLPVIDSRSSGRVIGIVTRESVLSAYWNALAAETQSSED